MTTPATFEKLEVYQRAHTVCIEVCRSMETSRNYGLRDQMIRSAISVPSNIAEGAERTSKAEFKQFLSYAKGSAGELRCQVSIAAGLKEIESAQADILRKELGEISRMIYALIKSLK